MGKALPDDVPIEAKMVTKAIERAQNTVEQRNAEIRKNVLKYDEVMNEQRKVIYKRRDQILEGADLREEAMEYLADAVDTHDRHVLRRRVLRGVGPRRPRHRDADASGRSKVDDRRSSRRRLDRRRSYDLLMGEASAHYEEREAELGEDDDARGRAPGDVADHRPAVA